MEKYELIVIGSGPAGEKAAVKAAYFGHRVAVIEKETTFGGAEMADAIPSKTLKETALYFSGKYEKGVYGIDRDLTRKASFSDFMFRKNYVSQRVAKEIRENLIRHKVDIYKGIATFENPHTLEIKGKETHKIHGDYILIATGSYPYHPPNIPFDEEVIHDSDSILKIAHFPNSLCIVGAGVIGCEYATIFSTMGTKVHLVNDKTHILPFVDTEISNEFVREIEDSGLKVHFNTSLQKIEKIDKRIEITLTSGTTFEVDMFLFAAGRSGNIKNLQCDQIGLKTGPRETVLVNKNYCTNIPHIYAVGDVIGFPALVSTSMDQGRVAVAHMFQTKDLETLPNFFPYGIYTIPEISMVGMTEEEAKKESLAYCTGKARYADMPRGEIMGSQTGFLKLVFNREDLIIRGVHIIGPLATEIVHFGLMLIEEKKTLYYVISTVFNFPTLHDLYKYAAYDGLSNLTGHKIKP